MKDFLDQSYNVDLLGGSRVSDQAWQNSFYVAVSASAHAALRCVTACLEDFREDLATISIPVLVLSTTNNDYGLRSDDELALAERRRRASYGAVPFAAVAVLG